MTTHERIPWMSLKDVCAYLNLDNRTVARGIHEGKIPGFAIGGRYLSKKDWLDLWLDGVWVQHIATPAPTKVEVDLPPYLRAV